MNGNEPEVILAAFPLLAAAAIGAVGAGIGAYGKYKAAKANKPGGAFKQKSNTGYLKRYMADLRGRSGNRARTELAMRPALRAIGAQQRQGQRMLAYQSAQQGLEGSGIEAQKQLSLQQGTTQAVAGLGEKVLNQQLTQARQMQAQREGQRMKLAGEIGRQEGAVSEANRLSQFKADEAMRQYDQRVSAAKGNIGISMLGGALSGAAPGISQYAQAAMMTPRGTPQNQQALTAGEIANTEIIGGAPSSVETNDLFAEEQQTDQWGNPISYGAQGGKVNKQGIAQYYNGGTVEDLEMAIPEVAKKRKAIEEGYQTEFETATAEFGTKKTDFETAETARKKQIEESNILADQQFEESEAKRMEAYEKGIPSLESETERIAKIKSGYEDFTTTEADRKKKEALQFATETEQFATETETYEKALKTAQDSPEFKMLEEKKDVLEKFNIGEEHYDKLRAGFEKGTGSDQLLDAELTAREEELLKKQGGARGGSNRENRYYLNNMINELGRGDDEYSLPSHETFSDYLQATKDEGKMGSFLKVNKRKKKKLLKKYAKQQGKMMPDELQGKEKPEYEFEPGEFKIKEELVAKDVPEYEEGVAPTKKEFVAGEFKEEAPTLQAPTEKELGKMHTWEIFKRMQAGEDVGASIAKAKTNRETTDFFKTFTAGNMTTDQMWSHPYAVANPAKIATLISTQHKAQQKTQLAAQKLEDKQFVDREKVRDNITQSLFDIDQISASGDPINIDDPETKDIDEGEGGITSGESIKSIVDANPDGVTPDQMQEILGYIDEIKASYGDEGGSSGEFDIGSGSIEEIGAVLQGMSEKSGSGKVTKLLKELLKLPILPAEGMLAGQIEQTPTSGTKQTKQVGGFEFKKQ